VLGELHLNRENNIQFLKKVVLHYVTTRNMAQGLYLLEQLTDGEIFWGTNEIEDAIESLRAQSDDLVLDFPHIHTQLTNLVGWLEETGLVSRQFKMLDAQYMV
jgi:hypothetical protein